MKEQQQHSLPQKLLLLLIGSILFLATAVKSDPNNSRIVGGDNTREDIYPYFVKMDGCGGALISPSVVLTAGHCNNQKDKEVIVGANYRNSVLNIMAEAETRNCTQYVKDPNYKKKTKFIKNDFALCLLDKPSKRTPIQLNNNINWPPEDTTDLISIGLGKEEKKFLGWLINSEILQEVTVPVVPIDKCIDAYENNDKKVKKTWGVCAGLVGNFWAGLEAKSACYGDSGGPLIYRKNNKDYHVGTVSYGGYCVDDELPTVYARTSHRFDWIKYTVCNVFEDKEASFC